MAAGPERAGAEPAPNDASADPEAPSEAFVGRERELAQLSEALIDVAEHQGRVFIITGEPGIGKTRLADEVTRLARDHGFLTLWGRCWEGGGSPPYWPWIQVLRSLIETDHDVIMGQARSAVPYLAAILPEAAAALDEEVAPAPIETDRDRFFLFDAITGALRRASATRPVLLVMDDLHAADHASLLMLRFLARDVRSGRMLLCATHRGPEAKLRPEVAEELAALTREAIVLPLGGLTVEEAERLVERTPTVDPNAVSVVALHRRTEGNPFFLSQILKLLAFEPRSGDPRPAQLDDLPIPESIRQTIRQRLGLLDATARDVLAVAAVIGRDFSLAVVSEGSGVDATSAAELLEEASQAGLLTKSAEVQGRYRFSHGLIRETVHDDLPPRRRAELHLRVGEMLERQYTTDPDPHIVELAHHFYEAATLGDRERAFRYALDAAQRQDRLFSNEEATRWYRRALELLDHTSDPPARRLELLLALGNALNRAGDIAAAREVFLQAAGLARVSGDGEALARAAVGYGRETWTTGVVDDSLVELLEEALSALPPEAEELKVDVESRLLQELLYSPDESRRRELAQASFERAKTLDDPQALSYALEGNAFASAGPDTISGWGGVGAEIIMLARQTGRRDAEASGRIWRLASLLAVQDIVGFDRELQTYRALVEELEEPNHDWYALVLRANRALLTGSLDQAEQLIEEASHIGKGVRREEAELYHAVQRFVAASLRGVRSDLEESLSRFNDLADNYPAMPVFRAVRSHLLANLGLASEARDEISRLAVGAFDGIPRNVDWLAAIALLCEASAVLGDATHARELHDLLVPYAPLNVVFDWSIASLGAVPRYLGSLMGTSGEFDRAIAHLEAGIDADSRMGARPYAAHGRRALAITLSNRDGPGDRERAQRLSAQAVEAYRELGMDGHAQDAEMLLAELGGMPVTSRPVAGPSAQPAVFRRDGEYWSIAFEGEAFRLKDAKGLHYLARLLKEPGRELHALDLFTASAPTPSAGAGDDRLTVSTGEGAGPALDAEAKAAYKRRLAELDADIEEAEAQNDTERAAKARQEREFFVGELAAAVGLGGRDRPTGSAAERARINVTKAIRGAMARIGEHSAALAQHLDRTVRTGTFCSYQPDPRAGISWRI